MLTLRLRAYYLHPTKCTCQFHCAQCEMCLYLAHNVTGKTFLKLTKDELKEIVTQIGAVAELQNLQNLQKQQRGTKVHMYVLIYK